MKQNQVLAILAAVVVVAAGAIYFFTTQAEEHTASQVLAAASSSTATDATAAKPSEPATPVAASDDTSALMVPGPLGDRALGDPKAPVTVIEYASMTCSHCQRFHSSTYPALKAKYIDTGKVYFIFREYPLDLLALAASTLARCAPAERYFPIVDLLFDTQRNWAFGEDPKTALFNTVKQAGFTQASFEACLKDQKIVDGINWVKDRAANDFGVDSTPSFFFNGEKASGEMSIQEIDKLIAAHS